MRRTTVTVFAALFSLLAVVACGGGSNPVVSSNEPIKIGLNMDYSGPASGAEGVEVWDGAQLAIGEINARGGVNGHQIIAILGDNQCDPSIGINAIRSLFAAGVVAIMGSNCSSVTLAQMPLVAQQKIPMLAVEEGNPGVAGGSGIGGNQWMFQLNENSQSLISTLGQNLIAKEVKSLAIIAVQSGFGTGVVQVAKDNLPGVTVTSTNYVSLSESNFRSLLSAVKSQHPEGLLLAMDFPQAGPLINQMHEVGFTNVKLYNGGGDIADPGLFPLLGNQNWADGLVSADRWAPGLPNSQSLATAFKAKYNEDISNASGMGYFGMQTLGQAMSTINGPISASTIRDALLKVNFDITGLGHVQFDSHHHAHTGIVLSVIKNGKIEVLKYVPST